MKPGSADHNEAIGPVTTASSDHIRPHPSLPKDTVGATQVIMNICFASGWLQDRVAGSGGIGVVGMGLVTCGRAGYFVGGKRVCGR